MNYRILFVPEIEDDLLSGYMWHAAKLQGLGEDFLGDFRDCARGIEDNPYLNTKVYKSFRRRLLKRFPYAVYYAVENDTIRVFGVFHCARNPVILHHLLAQRRSK